MIEESVASECIILVAIWPGSAGSAFSPMEELAIAVEDAGYGDVFKPALEALKWQKVGEAIDLLSPKDARGH